jgi:hypothetical protein
MAKLSKPLTVYIPDTRGVEVSPYGKGNLKIGKDVYTFSRLPGDPRFPALGGNYGTTSGTCPGATTECLAICYAARPVAEQGVVYQMWRKNSITNEVPPIPEDCTLLRIHVGGDFDSARYIWNWTERLTERPDVTAWAYTRSWRVPELLPHLERLRLLPNVQLFASMDISAPDVPPPGWRVAWIDGDARAGQPLLMKAHDVEVISKRNFITHNGTPSFICPEETKHKANCAECRYCFDGKKNDVTFLRH